MPRSRPERAGRPRKDRRKGGASPDGQVAHERRHATPAPFPDAEDAIKRLIEQPDERAVARFLEGRPGLASRAAVERFTDEVARLIHVDPDQAERLADASRWVAQRLGDDYCRGRALRSTANVAFFRGRYPVALQHYDEAVALFRSVADEGEEARTLTSSLGPLMYLGRYDEAFARADRARHVYEKAGDRLRLARLDSNLANLFYRQDRFPEALALYQRAYEEFRRENAARDVATALRNMATCYISLNKFPEALETHARARAYCEEQGLWLLVVGADYNIAYLHYLRGEYTRAIELYQLARQRSEELGDPYRKALCDLDEAELYLELNLVAEGMELARRAFQGFEALGMSYEAAKALTSLAIGTGREGESFRALELFEKARELFVREKNAVWPAVIDAYRALVLLQQGRYYEARRFAEAALEFFSQAATASKAALCELLLARIHLQVGELVSARAKCEAALRRVESAETPELSYRAHFLLGQIEEALGDRQSALQAYRTAHARLETLRSHLEQDELKIGFLKDKLAVYESLVWMALAGERTPSALESAFAYIEQAKSRSLADLLAFRAHALPGKTAVRSGLVEQVHGLRQELNWYYRRIDLAEIGREEGSPAHIEGLRRQSREREEELLRLLRDLRAKDVEFTSLQEAGIVRPRAIRSSIPRDGLILEYYEMRGTIVAAVLTRSRLQILPLTPASRVRHLLRLLQFQLSKFRLGAAYVQDFGESLLEATEEHLRELHTELVAPVRDLLQGEHLVIVPHDFLHYVPFHALLDGRRWLADEFAVSYAPSASVYHLCAAKQRGPGAESLVIGVPHPAAPFIVEEVQAVAATLPHPRVLLGEAASAESLREHGPRSRFVHIATHGLFRYDNPMFSSLQLGDSRLSLFDLYQLELDAELVTLSGCGTGLNVVEGGDELMGLVRGLLYAGAQAALVTLWDVNDQSTAEFMKAFYRRMRRGGDKAAAMQGAMRELRETYPHPYYWAPFVLVGKVGGTD